MVNSSIGFCLFGDRISVRSTIKFIKIVQIFLFERFVNLISLEISLLHGSFPLLKFSRGR